jgi:hypothetical protein
LAPHSDPAFTIAATYTSPPYSDPLFLAYGYAAAGDGATFWLQGMASSPSITADLGFMV